MTLGWIFVYLLLERLFELGLSARNRRRLLAKGGQEHHPESFRSLAFLHALFMVSLAFESYPWWVPLDTLTLISFCLFVVLQLVRYWCIWALGEFWNTRIIVVPGSTPSRRGPYRLLKHPNYLVVTIEFLVIPLLMRAPLTLVLFFVANLILLQRRIKLEEMVLRRETRYEKVF